MDANAGVGRTVHGRGVAGDGKPRHFRRFAGKRKADGHAAEVGEVFQAKGGQRYVVTGVETRHVSDDHIEDMDAWHEYPDGPGYYTSFTAVPVEDTAEERAARAAAAAKKQAEADATAARRAREADAWAPVAGHETVHSLPPHVDPDALTWETVSDDRTKQPMGYYGTVRSTATLPDGTKIGRTDSSAYDDYRTAYHVPRGLADEYHFERAHHVNRDLAKNEALAASTDYYAKEAQQFLDAYRRATPERQERFRRTSESLARVHAAPPADQFAELRRHQAETGHRLDRLWMPDAARAEYDSRHRRLGTALERQVPDREVREAVGKTPEYRARAEAAARGTDADEAALRDWVAAHGEPIARRAVADAREGRRQKWRDWYAANEPGLRAELGKHVPAELLPEALDYVKSQTAEAEAPPHESWRATPAAWAADVKDGLAGDPDANFDAADFPGLHAHGLKVRQQAADAEAERKKRQKEQRAANPDHEVLGNTYPHKDRIKALGGRWKDGRWVIPASAAGRLPRGLSSRPVR